MSGRGCANPSAFRFVLRPKAARLAASLLTAARCRLACRSKPFDSEAWDAACRWAFSENISTPADADELRDYKPALDERDRLGLNDALPIFSRLRNEAGTLGCGKDAATARASAAAFSRMRAR